MKNSSSEELERRMAEEIWLYYLNQYLYDHDKISEKEYERMTEKIAERSKKSAGRPVK